MMEKKSAYVDDSTHINNNSNCAKLGYFQGISVIHHLKRDEFSLHQPNHTQFSSKKTVKSEHQAVQNGQCNKKCKS